MYNQEGCGCRHHGEHHREAHGERQEGYQRDNEYHSEHHGEPSGERQERGHHGGCGCGRHGHPDFHKHRSYYGECRCGCHRHHGFHTEGRHAGCRCGCHQHHEGMGFRRHFVPREEVIARLEEYLKQLQLEARGVEERIAELKAEVSPQKE